MVVDCGELTFFTSLDYWVLLAPSCLPTEMPVSGNKYAGLVVQCFTNSGGTNNREPCPQEIISFSTASEKKGWCWFLYVECKSKPDGSTWLIFEKGGRFLWPSQPTKSIQNQSTKRVPLRCKKHSEFEVWKVRVNHLASEKKTCFETSSGCARRKTSPVSKIVRILGSGAFWGFFFGKKKGQSHQLWFK